ncbi:glycosyltransferase [Natronorarus salvus]|uniref:glycosyltransferase n=1 Tax=Natronorarus salvus TaxID=3117733 RepID=UPI002F2674D9
MTLRPNDAGGRTTGRTGTRDEVDVSLFLPSLNQGGAKRVMLNVADYLHTSGYRVEIVLARKEGEFLAHVPQGIEVRSFEKRVSRTVTDLIQYLHRREPKVLLSTIHSTNVVATWAGVLARTSTDVVLREATTISNQRNEFENGLERLISPVVKYTYPFADRYVAISDGVKSDLVRHTGVQTDEVRTIYNPIYTPEIAKRANEPVDHPWFDADHDVLLGVGRLTMQKDFATLIRAFSRVRRYRDARLIILGEGDRRGELERLTERTGLTDVIDLPGYVENPYKYMAKSDLFVLSSAWEGFGNVIVEAMACGTPVVATDCESGPAEILDEGSYGRLAPVGDPTALADSIVDSLNEPDEPDRLRERAAEFSTDEIMESYERALFGFPPVP